MSERFMWEVYQVLVFEAQCDACVHRGAGNTCSAFPKGIPKEIFLNEHDHRKPYPGDHGIRFESVEPARPEESAA